MRRTFFLLLLLPLFCTAQKQDVYVKLLDANGKQIIGDAMAKGLEKQLYALTMNTGGKNNSQIIFSMNVLSASADLKKAMNNGEILQGGTIVVAQKSLSTGNPVYQYSITMEGIRINACAETMGCNSAMNTNVTMTATRIGWTYYQQNSNGPRSVSKKYGFDSETGKEWTNF
ncbi:MAG: type VI secretion system tube protein Hcp [Ferruginibacter sp.]